MTTCGRLHGCMHEYGLPRAALAAVPRDPPTVDTTKPCSGFPSPRPSLSLSAPRRTVPPLSKRHEGCSSTEAEGRLFTGDAPPSCAADAARSPSAVPGALRRRERPPCINFWKALVAFRCVHQNSHLFTAVAAGKAAHELSKETEINLVLLTWMARFLVF